MPDRIPMPLSMAPVNHKTAGLDLCQLEGIAEELCQASLSNSSQRMYGTAQKQVCSFARNLLYHLCPANPHSGYSRHVTNSLLHICTFIFISCMSFTHCKWVWRPIKMSIATRAGAKRPKGKNPRDRAHGYISPHWCVR